MKIRSPSKTVQPGYRHKCYMRLFITFENTLHPSEWPGILGCWHSVCCLLVLECYAMYRPELCHGMNSFLEVVQGATPRRNQVNELWRVLAPRGVHCPALEPLSNANVAGYFCRRFRVTAWVILYP